MIDAYNNPLGWVKTVTNESFKLSDFYFATQRIRGLGKTEIPGKLYRADPCLYFTFARILFNRAKHCDRLLAIFHAIFYSVTPIFIKGLGWPPEWEIALHYWPDMIKHTKMPLSASQRQRTLHTLYSFIFPQWGGGKNDTWWGIPPSILPLRGYSSPVSWNSLSMLCVAHASRGHFQRG